MTRKTQNPTVLPEQSAYERDRVTETHPAFALAAVTRAQGTPRTLFQSEIQHSHTVTLSIRRAERARQLNRDWLFPRQELIEIEMSEAQWGALVSSVGIGSGVPVTLRATESDPIVPGLSFEPRLETSVDEARAAVGKLLKEARESLAALVEAVETRAGSRAFKDALSRHQAVLRNAEANAAFAVKSLNEATENVLAQARSDFETQVLASAQALGLEDAIGRPQLPAQLDQHPDTEEEA